MVFFFHVLEGNECCLSVTSKANFVALKANFIASKANFLVVC
jgi:hypothetical protein